MASKIASAASTLSSLLRQTTLEDHDEVLAAANNVLQKSKGDIEAQHVKVVALIKLDRFDDALRVFEEAGDKLKESARLEYAYALYKAGHLKEAERVVDAVDGGRGMKHVLAQVTYRSENFQKARELYTLLISEIAEAQEEENDLKINSGAADAQLAWAGQGHHTRSKKPAREDLEAFETAYNAACGSISRGELGQGEVLLRRAKDLCNALEELSDEEKKAEVLPIMVQQVYVLFSLGKFEEAEQIASELSLADIPDLSTRHIAQVNSLTASGNLQNPYMTHRIFHSSTQLPKTDQPFNFQSIILRQDAYAVDLLSMKHTGVGKSTETCLAQHQFPTTAADATSISVINAAAHAQNQTGKAALKEILPLLEKRPNDAGLLLTIVHLYLLTNNHAAATSLVENFFKRLEQSATAADLDVRYAPGLVATLISLYQAQGRKSPIKTELAKAASYWRHKSKAPPPSLMKAAGAALIESHNPEDLSAAGEIFSSLLQQDPADQASVAGFVAAYATSDPSKITEDHINSLIPEARLVQGIDAAALEDAGVASLPAPAVSESKKRTAPEKEKPAQPKKIRKSRLPKEYDPAKKPDPERWLPMRDRTYYRPKGKKGKAKMAGLTQGGAVAEEKAPAVEVPKQGGGGGGQAKNKKKKGKGGKW